MVEPKELSKELQQMNSNRSLTAFKQIQDSNEVSIYSGELTANCVLGNIGLIEKAFPSLPKGFYDIFKDRIADSGFNDERLNNAVNYVIDTCIYPVPTIANFLTYDKRVKLYNYQEATKITLDSNMPMDKIFVCLKEFQGRKAPVWVNVCDYELIKHSV